MKKTFFQLILSGIVLNSITHAPLYAMEQEAQVQQKLTREEIKEQMGIFLKDLQELNPEVEFNPHSLSTIEDQILDHNLFSLHDTEISMVPSSLGKLTNLTEISISKTPITDLPESIGNLTNLSELSLMETQLMAIPQSFEKLTNLQKLKITHTPYLCNIPESIGKLRSLEEFYLAYCPITSMPESMGDLTNLRRLHLQNTKLTGLPETILKLKLQQLNLTDTPIAPRKQLGRYELEQHFQDKVTYSPNRRVLRSVKQVVSRIPSNQGK